ncbi:MAG TPA: GNAT family N-acetyltransferase [Anaerolineales bacterium]|jgi:N-acetylglutamate synthase-like GNAT family acetyltransferase|nr:GNAT family N-acetyltransferase [Anaerolineales bacterium]
MASLRRLSSGDLPRLRQFWIDHWGGEEMITRGNVYRPEQLEGFVVEDEGKWIGLITFVINDGECEVTSLDSLRKGQGIGSTLIERAIEEARLRNCKRLFLITTNDNLNALGFYQKRGFEIVTVYRGAVNESRKSKPSIPLVGYHNIPLRDEIELEIQWKA